MEPIPIVALIAIATAVPFALGFAIAWLALRFLVALGRAILDR